MKNAHILGFRFIIMTLFFLFYQSMNSQELNQSIRGKVVDKDSKTPLIGVNLVIKDSEPMIGTITDNNGEFKFDNLPLGRYNFQAFYMGYEPGTAKNVLINAGKEAVLTIELSESIEQLEEIIIKSDKRKGETNNEMAIVSARSFSVEETKRYAGSFNDPARMASSYAGVSGNPEGNNDIVIRGNSPRGLLWRLEGIEIPNPNHFAEEGASGGPIGILNSNMLRNSDFMTGAFPAEYGNAYSGVFDINLRKGNNENREYSFMAGVLGLDCSIEGPFKKDGNASYLFNYRYSTLAVLNSIGVDIAGDAVPEFQDIAFNISLPTKKAGNFSLFGIGGLSKITEEEEDYRDKMKTNMGVIGLSHTYFIDNSTYFKSVLALTGSTNKYLYELPDENNVFYDEGYEDFVYKTAKATFTFNRKMNAKNTLKAGLIYSNLHFDLKSEEYVDDLGEMITYVDQNGNTALVQSFVNWKHRLMKNITVLAGVHYMQFMLNDNNSLEPRLGIQWQFLPNHSINAGFGVHSKIETLTTYYANTNLGGDLTNDNKHLELSKARHYVLAYNYNINPNFLFKLELYYQDLYNVPVSKDTLDSFSSLNYSDGYTDINMANNGTGYNYGAEISLEKYFSKNYYFMFTSSIYESKYKGSDYILRNTKYNSNYVFNLLGGKEIPLKKNKTLSFSLKASVAGGLRYTEIDLDKSIEKGWTVRDSENIFTSKRDDFIRIDLKLRYSNNKRKSTRQWEIDIQNVTNTLNVVGDYYSSSSGEIETWTQMGLIPVLSYRIEF